MAVFVKLVCRFPGHWWAQVATLGLSCVAMTLVALGISATARTAERAAERAAFSSVFLVGLQLPLSGVVLALPDYLLWLCRPLVNAFWAWAGYFNAMTHSRLYDAFRLGNERWLPTIELSLVVLALQSLAGVGLIIYGCRRLRWGEGGARAGWKSGLFFLCDRNECGGGYGRGAASSSGVTPVRTFTVANTFGT